MTEDANPTDTTRDGPDTTVAGEVGGPHAAEQSAEQLGGLMQEGAQHGHAARLESEALAAARAAMRAAADVLESASGHGASPHEAQEPAAQAPQLSPAKLWTLRAILIVNFALMGVMLALPSTGPSAVEPIAHDPAIGGEPVLDPSAPVVPAGSDPIPLDVTPQSDVGPDISPFIEPYRDPRLIVPDDEKYTAALLASKAGDFDQAAKLMHAYVVAHPNLDPGLLQNVYFMLANYLRMAGRIDEAVEFEMRARRMYGQTHLPRDLWQAARAAEARGDAREMRRAYARLLLQQNMLTPTQYSVVTEAYLKLGESYRTEADQGAERARAEEAERLRKLRDGEGEKQR